MADRPPWRTSPNPPASASTQSGTRLFVADPSDQRIRRIDLLTATISTVAGEGRIGYSRDGTAAVASRLNFPRGVLTDGTTVWIADTGNCVVRRLEPIERGAEDGRWLAARRRDTAQLRRHRPGRVRGVLNKPTGLALAARRPAVDRRLAQPPGPAHTVLSLTHPHRAGSQPQGAPPRRC
jgi:hypothetical protein